MIGSDDTKAAELRASRLELRVDRLEDKLADRQDEIDQLRDRLRDREDRIRFLLGGLERLHRRARHLTETRNALADAGLSVPFLPADVNGADRPDLRLKEIDKALEAIEEGFARLLDGLDGEDLEDPADAYEILADHLDRHNVEERAASEATSIADVLQLWVQADSMDRYRKELLVPYVDALTTALDASPGQETVRAAKVALPLLKEAFNDSRTYLLRRSSDLDGHEVPVDVGLDRLDQDPNLALDRFGTVVDQARAVGAVDFFHNLHVGLEEAVREDVEGAGAAAWILADATVAVLTDGRVKDWLATGIT